MTYLAQMEQRMARMDALFRRIESISFEVNKLRNAFGLSSQPFTQETESQLSVSTMNTHRPAPSVVSNPVPSFESTTQPEVTDLPSSQNIVDDIDIDSIIASMDLNLQL